ncbi:hypothetical protein Dsin_032375 [Dipteronia sinensis]|uniref:Zinc finger PMZ-type domain-containing protein n=1 Tax=Dipteronia sinensis TaxID=43782 RepID=A0AAE0DT81_9ROSI|nr:hypothetical protein Dsin_032375 [Dipteronia sinensis]
MLEFIRMMLMRKFQERKEKCAKWNFVIPPRVNARILKNSRESMMLTILSAGEMEYEVLGPDGSYVVKLRQYSYGCGSWQITNIPCSHAMTDISPSYGRDSLKDKEPNQPHSSVIAFFSQPPTRHNLDPS